MGVLLDKWKAFWEMSVSKETPQSEKETLVVIHSHTWLCDGATRRLLLLEIFELVDLVRGLFVWMDPAVIGLVDGLKAN
jgi:hypothetical protein